MSGQNIEQLRLTNGLSESHALHIILSWLESV